LCRNCLLKHGIEGKIEGMRRGRRRRKELMANLKEMRRDWMLKEEALDYSPWRTRFVKLQWICPKTDFVIVT
jgi:hypothetical protein